MKIHLSSCGALAATALLASTASAQTITTIVLEGQTVAGVGDITSISNVEVNNNGDWLIEVDTNNADTNIDGAVLDSSGGVFQEGDPLTVPGFPLAVHDSWDSVRLNNLGDSCWNHFIDNTASSSDDSGVFWNNTLVIQEGEDTFPISGLAAPNPWTGFFEVFINDLNQLLVMGSVNEPTLGTSTTDRFLIRLQLDALGAITSSTIIGKEDDVLPGMGTGRFDDVDSGSNAYGFNNNGDAIFIVDVDTPVNGDKIIYTWIGGVFTVVAEENVAPFFDAGRTWAALTGAVHMNDLGNYVYTGDLDGTTPDDAVIVSNIGGVNAVFKREGDTFPAISPFVLAGGNSVGGTSGNLRIDNNNDITWHGQWDDPDTTRETGIFRNETLLVQEGVTVLEAGLVARILTPGTDKLAVSDDGRYIMFEAELTDFREGVFLIDMLGTPNLSSLCNGDGGDQLGCTDCPCGNNAAMGTIGGCINSATTSARLEATGDPSVSLPSGDTTDLRFGISGAPGLAFCILNSGDNVAPTGMANPCFGLNSGVQSAQFDGLRCAVGNTLRHGGRSADANGDVGVTNNPWGGEGAPAVGIAQQGAGFASGQTRYFQVINRDDPLAVCGRGLNTSQAVSVTFTP